MIFCYLIIATCFILSTICIRYRGAKYTLRYCSNIRFMPSTSNYLITGTAFW
nr:MAG TPA: hypothetical protein [Caudoviricetes sp.]